MQTCLVKDRPAQLLIAAVQRIDELECDIRQAKKDMETVSLPRLLRLVVISQLVIAAQYKRDWTTHLQHLATQLDNVMKMAMSAV